MGMDQSEILLKVDHLKMHFPIYGGVFKHQTGNVYAVDDVSFSIAAGKTMGLVGESGCGKTTLGRSIIRLYEPTAGKIIFKEKNILEISQKRLRKLRPDIQMIFQDPFESLNARHTVGDILAEPFIIHRHVSFFERNKKVKKLLSQVGLPKDAINRFPHEFSGGQRQRIGIARAIALKPKMIICDEPVSALDVSIQSQIINLLLDLQKDMQLTYLFIAHDLAVVKHVSDYIAVMYLGKIVEYARAEDLYQKPLHPYTQALINAIPVPDPCWIRKKKVLVGDVPSPANPPTGCSFHTRCPLATTICKTKEPALKLIDPDKDNLHQAACHLL